MDNMKHLITLTAALVLLNIACGQTKEQPRSATGQQIALAAPDAHPTDPPPPDCRIPLIDEPGAMDPSTSSCPPATCGGNSPVVNNFPINGLRTDCINGEGVWMVPHSLKVPNRDDCSGKPLVVDPSGVLIAGECIHEELVDASFDVRIVDGTATSESDLPTTIFIRRAGYVQMKVPPEDPRVQFAYEFRVKDSKVSLCDRKEGKDWRSKMRQEEHKDPVVDDDEGDLDFVIESAPLTPAAQRLLAGITEQSPLMKLDAGLAIVRTGELFNKRLITIARGDKTPAEPHDAPWMSIQCVRDALAKADLYEIAPQEADQGDRKKRDEYLSRRRAALAMLTANYCRTEHYTANGIEIQWDTTPFKDPPPAPAGLKIEAAWGETADGKIKALCISESRAWFRDWSARHSTMPTHVFPAACQPTEGDPRLCRNESGFVVQYQKECNVEKCVPGALPKNTKLVSYRPRKKRWAR